MCDYLCDFMEKIINIREMELNIMKYIKPKGKKKTVNWEISENTLTILSHYCKYTNYDSEEEVVDKFLENLLTDARFIDWLKKQRYTKKINSILEDCELITTIEGVDLDAEDEEVIIT